MADDDPVTRAEQLIRERKAEKAAQQDRGTRGLGPIGLFLDRFIGTARIVWQRYLRPTWHVFNRPFRWYWRLCRWMFRKFAFRGEQYSKPRGAAAFVALSLFTIFLGFHLVVHAIPIGARLAYDAAAITLFSREEVLIFSQPDPVEGRPGELTVYACRKYPCEAQFDSVEFRMRDSLFLDVRSYLKYFQPHDPGELAGAFVSEENGCKVRYYGRRVKSLDIYPMIFRAVCQPINGSNATDVLDGLASARLR
ncbi:hypothetical protein [Mameliella alba]|uniref:hypothetical protein n=1 Tax=Mameliella alba TaxID=561184 RepID=UPI000B52E92C|nr:hypothetical protein [Mameliella alba]OWV42679.1 hypothetical protein CDZ95_13960 [Mameliella alba]OWV63455.1 hypothetical protein CDZ97_15440 [Mameliella alba]